MFAVGSISVSIVERERAAAAAAAMVSALRRRLEGAGRQGAAVERERLQDELVPVEDQRRVAAAGRVGPQRQRRGDPGRRGMKPDVELDPVDQEIARAGNPRGGRWGVESLRMRILS